MPINYLIIVSLQRFHQYYGDDFKVECPTGPGIPAGPVRAQVALRPGAKP